MALTTRSGTLGKKSGDVRTADAASSGLGGFCTSGGGATCLRARFVAVIEAWTGASVEGAEQMGGCGVRAVDPNFSRESWAKPTIPYGVWWLQ